MEVKKQFSVTAEFQTINVEEMMDIGKSQFGKHHGNNCFCQESLMDAKISERKHDKK